MTLPPAWRKSIGPALDDLRDSFLTILIAGGAQMLLALVVWPILFGRYPQGFSMALSLVGFGNWLVSAFLSLGIRGRARVGFQRTEALAASPSRQGPTLSRMQSQLQRSGCGFTLFLSGLIPLGLAFLLRVRADLRRGMTWGDLFPPAP